jgi:hypothetical protein
MEFDESKIHAVIVDVVIDSIEFDSTEAGYEKTGLVVIYELIDFLVWCTIGEEVLSVIDE